MKANKAYKFYSHTLHISESGGRIDNNADYIVLDFENDRAWIWKGDESVWEASKVGIKEVQQGIKQALKMPEDITNSHPQEVSLLEVVVACGAIPNE